MAAVSRNDTRRHRRILSAVAASVVLVDAVWLAAGSFTVDWRGYILIGGLSALIFFFSWFYEIVRRDPRLAAMLFGTAFLCVFSAAFSLLNYLLLTVAGPRIDGFLAALDQSLGFDWPAIMAFAAGRPGTMAILGYAYNSVLPGIALLMVLLGVWGDWRRIYAFCYAICLGAGITVGIWTLYPAFGALTVYELPPEITAQLHLVVDAAYERELLELYASGPGFISPGEAKGLIAFPSFHAVMAVLVAWYAWRVRVAGIVTTLMAVLILVATPVHGSHYVIDVIAGVFLALAVAAVVDRILAFDRPEHAAPVPEAAYLSSGRQSMSTWPGRTETRSSQARIPG